MIGYKNSDFFGRQLSKLSKLYNVDEKPEFIITRTYSNSSIVEIGPRGFYSRNSSFYQEIDLGEYLLFKLRSTSHYIVKAFTKDDIIYLNI